MRYFSNDSNVFLIRRDASISRQQILFSDENFTPGGENARQLFKLDRLQYSCTENGQQCLPAPPCRGQDAWSPISAPCGGKSFTDRSQIPKIIPTWPCDRFPPTYPRDPTNVCSGEYLGIETSIRSGNWCIRCTDHTKLSLACKFASIPRLGR